MYLLLIVPLVLHSVRSQGTSETTTFFTNDTRIIGGFPIEIEAAPWQVAIIYNGYLECGGSVISSKLVLTAAHCLNYGKIKNFRIRAGSKLFRKDGQVREITKAVINANFNKNTQEHDIAIAKLRSPLTLSNFVSAVKLAANYQSQSQYATVTGWGMRQEQDYNPSPKLRAVKVRFVSLSQCRKDYKGVTSVTENMVCAGAPSKGGKDACQGDSGGPLVENGLQYGVVSFGIGCGRAKYPGVYTSISAYRSWIEKTAASI